MKLRAIKFPSSGYRSPLLSYWAVIAFVVLQTVVCLCFRGIEIWSDTHSYYAAGESLFNGIIDASRTPVYPLILQACRVAFGYEGSQIAVFIIQAVTYLLSVLYFDKSVRIIIPKRNRTSFWLTVVYVFFTVQTLSVWASTLMTESFAVPWTVFLIYCLIRSSQDNAPLKYAVYTSIWLVLLVFLRPASLSFLIVAILFWIALWLLKRGKATKLCIIGVAGSIIATGMVGVYSSTIYKKYGIHSISCVSIVNNYASLRYFGLITPDDTADPAFKTYLEQKVAIKSSGLSDMELWTECGEWRESIPLVTVEEAINHAIQARPTEIAKAIYTRFCYVRSQYPMALYHYALAFAFVVILIVSFRKRQLLIIPTTLFLIAVSTLATMYLGTFAEWGRLSIPCMPAIVILFGWCCSHIRIVPPKALARQSLNSNNG